MGPTVETLNGWMEGHGGKSIWDASNSCLYLRVLG
jgi:hypothetical protein